MNKTNGSNNFDYDEYLKRIKSLNNDVENFSLTNNEPKPQHPKTQPAKDQIQQIPTSVTNPKSAPQPISTQSRTPQQLRQNPQPKTKVADNNKSAANTAANQNKPKSTQISKQAQPQKKPTQSDSNDLNKTPIKIALVALICILFCIILAVFISHNSNSGTETTLDSSEVTQQIEDEITEEETTEQVTEAVTYSYETLLVNFENPIPDDYTVELVDYQDQDGNWWTVASELITPLDEMCAAAANDGVYLIINSAYRSYEAQEKLFLTSVEEYEEDGYEYDEALELTEGLVADPGTSEHQTGIAVDFGYTGDTTWTRCYTWLDENSYKYGFIVRYPDGKTDITQISYEPWHFRYVGVEIATEMYELDLCLEEYYELKGW